MVSFQMDKIDGEMPESIKDTNQDDEEEEENGDSNSLRLSQASLLPELNLLMLLYVSSLAWDECLDSSEKTKKGSVKDDEAKRSLSKAHTLRRETNNCTFVTQRRPKFLTKIRDSRHCRRM
ncbi:PREDICTED: uncharacterized protein LOC104603957 isoform X2 [Nelumbo nucifera]|uniref:Uncharacterized protein LOC104603957 isoform X2 n=2 Tax=Nelumbo nucifera TaxID=4432 RepID=A0A1U8AFT7_NELNU|nr:PREDICTED: uncharacterized protein LOC104603957 isoform X2 [Nelumbo nucifera]DAD36331.1 TPA_asm: hypothetical protein HUJ06_006972 [Nelumbo nucifera]